MDHPNIVNVYEMFDNRDAIFIVTEVLEGGELFDYIVQKKVLTELEACSILRKVLEGVNYCHQKGVAHRDIKPENLLLKRKQDISQLKIVDFGCSERVKGAMSDVIGTPYYIAPEVLNKNYNQKCDIWSCGVLLYIFFTGRPPFAGKNFEEVKAAILACRYDRAALEKSGSKQGVDLCTRMMTLDQRLRPSAAECLAHPWFKALDSSAALEAKELERVVSDLKDFVKEDKMVRLIEMYMYFKYETESSSHLEGIFKAIDKNGDGQLSRAEVEQVIQEKRVDSGLTAILFRRLSEEAKSSINYSEFLVACADKRKLLCEQRIDETFKMIDGDGSGKISVKELKAVLGGADIKELKDLTSQVDANSDGEISLD
jgi:calcium-dependent protein kinase